MELRIGILPLPVYLVLLGVIVWFTEQGGKFPSEICMMMAVLAVGGFTCGEIGKRLPVLHHFGAAAIFATFVPSYLVYAKILPEPLITGITDFTKGTNFLYLFIAAVIVGSILGMDRTVLIRGFLKIFIPISVGTVLATLVGVGVGTALGLGAKHTLFYLVVPVMAGGVGEGAIPLSTGYAEILHLKQGDQFASVLPSVMIGSLIAILLSGVLNFVGKKYPHLTGDGRLQPDGHDELDPKKDEITGHMDVSHVAAAGSLAIMLYVFGLFLAGYFAKFQVTVPAALSMLAIINACRCGQGGTGDVAILTASSRMQLMPFAQIATRIGGLITVTLALVALRATL